MRRFTISGVTAVIPAFWLLAGIASNNTNFILVSISLWLMMLVVQGMTQDLQLEKEQAE